MKRMFGTMTINHKIIRRRLLVSATLLCCLGQSVVGWGRSTAPAGTPTPTPDQNTLSTDRDPDQDTTTKQKRGSWVFAPIPINSPTFGTGLIGAVGYVFKLKMKDEKSPPSVLGAALAFTNSGSRGLALASHLYFSENKYQTTVAFAKGRAIYDFWGIGLLPNRPKHSINIRQNGQVFFGEFLRNFGKNIFIGPRYQYRKLTARLNREGDPEGFQIPSLDLTSTTVALGFHIQRDVRDHTFYPRKGSLFDFKADFFGKALGSNRNYQTYGISYNGYRSFSPHDVLAYRAAACSVSDNAPFFDLCFFGARGDLRGYTAGEFQDRRLWATQAEWRHELKWRLGIVGFAGIGGIAHRWSKMRFDELLPGGGVGLRFKLDKANHINYRVDLGFGRGGHTLSMSVTEAF